MDTLIMLGLAAGALTAITIFLKLVVSEGRKFSRLYDSLMGNGSGRQPLRDVLEKHIESDAAAFREVHELTKHMHDEMLKEVRKGEEGP